MAHAICVTLGLLLAISLAQSCPLSALGLTALFVLVPTKWSNSHRLLSRASFVNALMYVIAGSNIILSLYSYARARSPLGAATQQNTPGDECPRSYLSQTLFRRLKTLYEHALSFAPARGAFLAPFTQSTRSGAVPYKNACATTTPRNHEGSMRVLGSGNPLCDSSVLACGGTGDSGARRTASAFILEVSGPPTTSTSRDAAASQNLSFALPSVGEDEILIAILPADDPPPTSHAEVWSQVAIEYSADGSRRVPSGPKPDTGRPKKKYKPVAQKVKPLQEHLPMEYRIERHRPADCMDSLPPLPVKPPVWTPTTSHLTTERMAGFNLAKDGFLQPEEVRLFEFLLEHHQEVFAWEERERRRFKDEYFPPVRIPVVPHIPWTDKHIPIPRAIYDRLVALLKEKIAAGVYEDSNSAYRSGWFCVLKKDGTSLRIVHDLQRLNSVSIRDAGTLPSPDDFSELCAGRTCIGSFDQYSSYDLQLIHPDSRDLTTFQSPLGPKRLVVLPQGYTNAVSVQHNNLVHILEPEMPDDAGAFVDDVQALGPRSYYLLPNGSYETIPGNSGIRRFIWEYAQILNRVLQRLNHSGGSISGKKALICVPKAVVVGYEVSFEGRRPLQEKVQRILDWPACQNVSDIRAFLGTAGIARFWIRNFALIARPLTNLVKKDIPWDFDAACHEAMIQLKEAVVSAPCIRPIDYRCGRDVILAVDSSIYGVGFVLIQLGEKGERYPSRFGSIAWNEVEARYSQPKVELYGLWRALRNVRLYVFGLPHLLVETDAKYIKGMLNHPDLQPNATINRWIAGVLLFPIRLVHVPGDRHSVADGLSRRSPAPNDPQEPDDPEEWLDNRLGLWLSAALDLTPHTLPYVSRTGRLLSPALRSSRDRRYYNTPGEGPFALSLAAVFANAALDIPTPSLPHNIAPDGSFVVPPRSEAQQRKDEHLTEIDSYLRDLSIPEHVRAKNIPWFVRQAGRFFRSHGQLLRRDDQRKHKVVIISPTQRMAILESAHDDTGHKGTFPTEALIRDRFWWPSIAEDVRWYCRTCDECQRRSTLKLKIPPTVVPIATLFQRVHVDTMHLPTSHGKKYFLHMRCGMTSYPEGSALAKETGRLVGEAIFRLILCRWGYVAVLLTDNGPPIIAGIEYLAETYGINHITISGYNSQANGAVEHKHFDVRESLVKLCDGDMSRWTQMIDLVLWSERITIRKATGMSPYYMAHGVEPIMPMDLAHATYLVPPAQPQMSTTDLIVLRARQLQRRDADLAIVREKILESRFRNMQEFLRRHGNSIRDFNFAPGSLVLIRNTRIEKDLGLKKTEDRYYGPMVVVQRNSHGSYVIAELDGAVSILRCAAFRVIPYFPRLGDIYDISDILETSKAQLELMEKLDEPLESDPTSDDPDFDYPEDPKN